MQNMPDFTEVMRLAKTPEGQKLIAMLQNSDSGALNSAMKSAQSGDYNNAKSALADILSNPEVQKLLQQFGR